MGSKMLSAAGINNIQSRVRVKRNPPRRRSTSSTVATRENPPDTKENQMRGNHRPSSSSSSKVHVQSNNIDTNLSNSEQRQRRIRSISRPRIKTDRFQESMVELKQRSRNRVESIKERSRNGMDGMKQKSRNGVDRVKKVVPKKPNIRLKPVPSRPLPSRSLFQHKPRTWYGTKQKDPNKVKEQDWRNDRPEAPKKKKKKSSSSREEEYQETLLKRKESRSSKVTEEHQEGQPIPLKKGSRTRSGSSRVSASEEYDWKQYIVQEKRGVYCLGRKDTL